MSYVLRELARGDLESIWQYTLAHWGLEQADKYITQLTERFSWLSQQPHVGKSRNEVRDGYYSFPEGEHVIFYKASTPHIESVGIVHHSQDIGLHFRN